jgi:hypothetical protein
MLPFLSFGDLLVDVSIAGDEVIHVTHNKKGKMIGIKASKLPWWSWECPWDNLLGT